MAKVTDFEMVAGEGLKLAADAHGNNVALRCVDCAWPVLAVLMDNQRGTAADKPTTCKGCGSKFWVGVDETKSRLVLNRVAS